MQFQILFPEMGKRLVLVYEWTKHIHVLHKKNKDILLQKPSVSKSYQYNNSNNTSISKFTIFINLSIFIPNFLYTTIMEAEHSVVIHKLTFFILSIQRKKC